MQTTIQAEHRPRARPLGVTLISILAIIVGFVSLIAAAGLIIASGFLPITLLSDSAYTAMLFTTLVATTVVPGIILITLGTGLSELKPWSWWIAVITGLGSIASSGYSTFIIYFTGMAPGLFAIPPILGARARERTYRICYSLNRQSLA